MAFPFPSIPCFISFPQLTLAPIRNWEIARVESGANPSQHTVQALLIFGILAPLLGVAVLKKQQLVLELNHMVTPSIYVALHCFLLGEGWCKC